MSALVLKRSLKNSKCRLWYKKKLLSCVVSSVSHWQGEQGLLKVHDNHRSIPQEEQWLLPKVMPRRCCHLLIAYYVICNQPLIPDRLSNYCLSQGCEWGGCLHSSTLQWIQNDICFIWLTGKKVESSLCKVKGAHLAKSMTNSRSSICFLCLRLIVFLLWRC